MTSAFFFSIVGIFLSVLALFLGIRRAKNEQSLETFKRVCDLVRTSYSELNADALRVPQPHRDLELPVLTKVGWIPPKPLDLADVRITLREPSRDGVLPSQTLRQVRKVLPRTKSGSRYRRYSEVLPDLYSEVGLYNGTIYRVLDMASNSGCLELSFAEGEYFDHLDTSYVLTIEAAVRRFRRKRRILNGSYRRYLVDPFDLTRRSPGLGVNTLTVRRGADGCGFYMHRRNKNNVTEAPEVLHVVPAGEFTPSDVGLQAVGADFDLWRNIVREYAEEFLDVEEAYGKGGRPIDFARDDPFRELMQARQEGRLGIHVLGMGFDPLDWKPALFTVCVFEAETFDRIFVELLRRRAPEAMGGKEGVIVLGDGGRGIPFTQENVDLYAKNRSTVNAGVSCLRLAWRHRVVLGLDPVT